MTGDVMPLGVQRIQIHCLFKAVGPATVMHECIADQKMSLE